ncbi:hypothetical protein [Brucella cytisi]|uniref:hypothetical protein n=1 Tax=Brucella cytisi TaxID=407152 RepID=UPI0016B0DA31|nr:hypothetical protein [Brucella cytisi]
MPKSKRAGTASSSVATKVATKPAKAAKAASKVCPAALPPLQSKRNKEWKIHTQGYFKAG